MKLFSASQAVDLVTGKRLPFADSATSTAAAALTLHVDPVSRCVLTLLVLPVWIAVTVNIASLEAYRYQGGREHPDRRVGAGYPERSGG